MRLYVWKNLDSIGQYGPGMAFAHAKTRREAIILIIKSNSVDLSYGDGGRLWKELKTTEPEVYAGEHGHAQIGSA
jgi:hypothetical protein